VLVKIVVGMKIIKRKLENEREQEFELISDSESESEIINGVVDEVGEVDLLGFEDLIERHLQ
jgi:hypothetical protein